MSYPLEHCRYPSDVHRIIEIAQQHGIVATPFDAERAWEEFSASMAAGWMYLYPEDDDVWASLPEWFKATMKGPVICPHCGRQP